MDENFNWIKIADNIAELPWQENNMCVVEAGGKKITLARKNEAACAFAYKCPHAGGIMANGYLDAMGNVVCPLHRYRFNMLNGRNTSGEGYYLQTFAVRIVDRAIYVGFKSGLFSF
jgi:nitrite reductase/ring-hydroxylating ferredoxin subunit